MRILVCVHIFYKELWSELASCLENIPEAYELYVTCVDDVDSIRKMVHPSFPFAQVVQVKNRGFDVGPFFYAISQVDLNNFDIVIKLHTKRNIPEDYYFRINVSGTRFRDHLLAFCRTRANWEMAKLQLARKDIGMVGSGRLTLNRFSDFLKQYSHVYAPLEKAGLCWRGGYFIAGTMFAIKADLLKPWQNVYTIDDFPTPDRSRGDCLPHFLERALGYSVYSQGYRIASWDGKHFESIPYLWKIGRYLFHIHHGRKRTIIRLCGIPIWFHKHKRG